MKVSLDAPHNGNVSLVNSISRLAAMQDLRSVPVVPTEFLFSHVLPPVPPTVDLENLKANLRSKNVVRKIGWRGFETPPNNSKNKDSLVFQPLVGVFNNVLESVPRDETLSAVLQMKLGPDSAPFSKRTNKSRPDAFLELLKRKSVDADVRQSNWEDISVSMEFKKSDSDRDKHDVSQLFVYLCLLYSFC
jgi:hypothetical protein